MENEANVEIKNSDEVPNSTSIENITQNAEKIVQSVIEAGHLKKGDLFVVGCSSSEVSNFRLGTHSNEEIGKMLFNSIYKVLKKNGIYIAAQCCEHLNRALVVEEELARSRNYQIVCAVPWLKGGGSFATAAYNGLKNPVLVEHISAEAGIDIGGVLIGMHLKDVAVPFRTEPNTIGQASVIAAYTRPKLIGGERARYTVDTK